jgi:hypothetical protein
VQVGKKKLVLDHLIVQKMDDDDENGGEDVKSILTYGAQALFESDQSQAERDINCNSFVSSITMVKLNLFRFRAGYRQPRREDDV